jgi:uncharacterized protein YndB with AHSA1/START domain
MTTFGQIGTLTTEDGDNVITFIRTLPAPPERVWRALATADGITSWLAPSASIDARLGGVVEMTFDAENVVTGTITTWDPFSTLAHTWVINDEVSSELRYELSPTDGGTELRLIHTKLPDEMCGGYTPGWHAYLARLDAVLAGNEPPSWMDVFGEVAHRYA